MPLDTYLIAYYTTQPWRFVGSLLWHFFAFAFDGVKTYVLLRFLLGDKAPGFAYAVMVAVAVSALDQMFFFVPARLGTLEGIRCSVVLDKQAHTSLQPLCIVAKRPGLADAVSSAGSACHQA
jgi:hypothetical protein